MTVGAIFGKRPPIVKLDVQISIERKCMYVYSESKVAHTFFRITMFPFVSWFSAWHDALSVPSLDRLWLSAYSYTPTAMSVIRRLN